MLDDRIRFALKLLALVVLLAVIFGWVLPFIGLSVGLVKTSLFFALLILIAWALRKCCK